MKKKKKKKKNTNKQRKLLKLFSENLGKAGFTKTMYDLMLEAGYANSSAKQQSAILAGIREEVQPIVSEFEGERDRAIKLLKKKIGRAKYRDLIDAVDKLTKNIQLLSDKPTENIKDILTDEQIDELLRRRTKKNSQSRKK